MLRLPNFKNSNSRYQLPDGYRTIAHLLNLLAIILGLLALSSMM